jgi:hypothetical protein
MGFKYRRARPSGEGQARADRRRRPVVEGEVKVQFKRLKKEEIKASQREGAGKEVLPEHVLPLMRTGRTTPTTPGADAVHAGQLREAPAQRVPGAPAAILKAFLHGRRELARETEGRGPALGERLCRRRAVRKTTSDIVRQLRAGGAPEEEIAKLTGQDGDGGDFEIWPENADALRAFLFAETQWRRDRGDGGRALHGPRSTRRWRSAFALEPPRHDLKDAWYALRVLEAEARCD